MNVPLSTPVTPPNNKMALTSMVGGIVGWVLWVLILCAGAVITLATFGLAGICFAIIGYLPVIPWLAAVITGHMGIAQVARTGERGRGMAIAGLIMGYLGVALILCWLALTVVGVSLPVFQGLFRQYRP